ncbi:hypothetical protein DESC_800002 [Desulfosarcina cetonica]|nr:hypothetical protein DESC_800002 [Desulfosarcina cetonica]
MTDSFESPIVSRNALLSLVALVRRLHELRDSSNSGGVDDYPRGATGTDNRISRTTTETSNANANSREVLK